MIADYPRKIQYPFKGGEMVLSEGKVFTDRETNKRFQVTHMKSVIVGQNYITEVWVKNLDDKTSSAMWKRITNGVYVEEFRIDWLCEV